MSTIPPIATTPFIINKSIMKYPLRNPIQKGYFQVKHRNVPLLINKKYAELHHRFIKLRKDKIISQMDEELKDPHDLKVYNLKQDIDQNNYEKELHAVTQKHMHNLARRKKDDEEDTAKLNQLERIKAKMEMEASKEKRLRGYIYESISPRTLNRLYSSYKFKLMKDEMKQKLSEAGTIERLHTNSDMEDYQKELYLSQVLREEGLDVNKVVGLANIKKKEIQIKPPREIKTEIGNMFLTGTVLNDPDLSEEEQEEKYMIDMFYEGQMEKRGYSTKYAAQHHKLANYMTKQNTYKMYKTMSKRQDKKSRNESDSESTLQNSGASSVRGTTHRMIRNLSEGPSGQNRGRRIQETSRAPSVELRKMFPETARQSKMHLTIKDRDSIDSIKTPTPVQSQLFGELQPRSTLRHNHSKTKSFDKGFVKVQDLVKNRQRDESPLPKIEGESLVSSLLFPTELQEHQLSKKLNTINLKTKSRPNLSGSQITGDYLYWSNGSPEACDSTTVVSNRDLKESIVASTIPRKSTSRSNNETINSYREHLPKLKFGDNVDDFYKKTESAYETHMNETRELMHKLQVGKKFFKKEYKKINTVANSKPECSSEEFKGMKGQLNFKRKLVDKLVAMVVNQDEALDAIFMHKNFNEAYNLQQLRPQFKKHISE